MRTDLKRREIWEWSDHTQAEERTLRERREYLEAKDAAVDTRLASDQREVREQFHKEKARAQAQIEEGIFRSDGWFRPTPLVWDAVLLYVAFVWLDICPPLLELVTPLTERLGTIPADRLHTIAAELTDNDTNSRSPSALRSLVRYAPQSTIQQFLSFVQKTPGMHAIAQLLHVADHRRGWFEYRAAPYGYLCMIDFPQIPGADPITLLRLLLTINGQKRVAQRDAQAFADRFLAYFGREKEAGTYDPSAFFTILFNRKPPPNVAEHLRTFLYKGRSLSFCCYHAIEEVKVSDFIRGFEWRNTFRFDGFPYNTFHDRPMAELRAELERQYESFAKQSPQEARLLRGCDELTQVYLLARAYDLSFYGQRVADVTFPSPHMQGAQTTVTALGRAIEAIVVEQPLQKKWQDQGEFGRRMVRINGAATLARVYAPPEMLPARVLSGVERTALKKACLAQLSASTALTVITDLVRFVDLLARPENHVKVPSTQYIEREVNTYTTAEMTNQMAKELLNLPPRTAYARIVNLAPGSETVWKGKIQPLALADAAANGDEAGRLALDNAITCGILRKRSVIEAAIRMRHEKWKREVQKPLLTTVNGQRNEAPPTRF